MLCFAFWHSARGQSAQIRIVLSAVWSAGVPHAASPMINAIKATCPKNLALQSHRATSVRQELLMGRRAVGSTKTNSSQSNKVQRTCLSNECWDHKLRPKQPDRRRCQLSRSICHTLCGRATARWPELCASQMKNITNVRSTLM